MPCHHARPLLRKGIAKAVLRQCRHSLYRLSHVLRREGHPHFIIEYAALAPLGETADGQRSWRYARPQLSAHALSHNDSGGSSRSEANHCITTVQYRALRISDKARQPPSGDRDKLVWLASCDLAIVPNHVASVLAIQQTGSR